MEKYAVHWWQGVVRYRVVVTGPDPRYSEVGSSLIIERLEKDAMGEPAWLPVREDAKGEVLHRAIRCGNIMLTQHARSCCLEHWRGSDPETSCEDLQAIRAMKERP